MEKKKERSGLTIREIETRIRGLFTKSDSKVERFEDLLQGFESKAIFQQLSILDNIIADQCAKQPQRIQEFKYDSLK
jgi:hypothetical protein